MRDIKMPKYESWGNYAQFLGGNVNFVVRASNESAALEGSIRNAVRELDPTLPVYNLWSMNELVSKSMVQPRFLALLLATFSGIALSVASLLALHD